MSFLVAARPGRGDGRATRSHPNRHATKSTTRFCLLLGSADAPRRDRIYPAPGKSSSGNAAERVPAIGGLSSGRNVNTTENFVCPVSFLPAA